jgi:hypothetical protein
MWLRAGPYAEVLEAKYWDLGKGLTDESVSGY